MEEERIVMKEERLFMPRSYLHRITFSELSLAHSGLYHCGENTLDLIVQGIYYYKTICLFFRLEIMANNAI